jgi:hypothetical protein
MWMACHGQEEIAERESIGQKTVDDVTKSLSGFGNLADSAKSLASHATDFDPPIYNIWKQQNKSEGSSHLGQGIENGTYCQGVGQAPQSLRPLDVEKRLDCRRRL